MKITVKKLQGGECILEVDATTPIIEIKRQVYQKLGIPVGQQKLLLLGRTLADDQTVALYPSIKEGTKLNLVVKKPEGLYEVSVKYFKKQGLNDTEASNTANKLLKIVQKKFNKLSWDDIEKLSMDCLMDEKGLQRPPVEKDTDSEDMYTL